MQIIPYLKLAGTYLNSLLFEVHDIGPDEEPDPFDPTDDYRSLQGMYAGLPDGW